MNVVQKVVTAVGIVKPDRQPEEAEAPAGVGADAKEAGFATETAQVDYVPPTDEDTTSILFIVPNDHDRIKGLYRRYKDPVDTPEQLQLLASQLLHELNLHCWAEEKVLYRAVADIMDDNHVWDHATDEHDSIRLFCSDLEAMSASDGGYEDKMHQLMETFLEHIHEEEHNMLPALRGNLAEAQLRELGRRFEEVKQKMPAEGLQGARMNRDAREVVETEGGAVGPAMDDNGTPA